MPEQEPGPVLRSQNSQVRSYVLFRNCTDRFVDVLWVDFQGELVWYGTLKPTDIKMINTFATHPWVFRDPDTGERMQIHGKDVFMPPPYRRGQLTRYLVPITFPMRTLRTNALWAISRLLQDPDRVHQLELPRCLILDLQDVLQCTAKAVEFKRRRQEDEVDDDDEGGGGGGGGDAEDAA